MPVTNDPLRREQQVHLPRNAYQDVGARKNLRVCGPKCHAHANRVASIDSRVLRAYCSAKFLSVWRVSPYNMTRGVARILTGGHRRFEVEALR